MKYTTAQWGINSFLISGDIITVTRDGIHNTFRSIQVLSKVNEDHLVALIKKFGMGFRKALIDDRVSEELRTFCANSSIDEVKKI